MPAPASVANGPPACPIYIVDDDVMFRDSVMFLLTTAGFDVVPPMSGGQFLDRVSQLAPGCVLVDLRMPDIDGFTLMALLGDRLASFPVIVLTGHGDLASAVRATRLGAMDFLEKPVDADELVAAITAVALRTGHAVRHHGQ